MLRIQRRRQRRGLLPEVALAWGAALAFVGCISSHPAEHGETPELKKVRLSACEGGLLDDLEDQDSQIIKVSGRDGYWFTFADNVGTEVSPSGQFVTTPGGRPGEPASTQMAHVEGTLADSGDSIYAGMGFAFTNPKMAYDVSQAAAVQFWAKGPGLVRFKTPDVNTDPSGDRCTDCYNDFGVDIYLSERWERYTVPFEKLKQLPGWGDRAPHVASGALFAVQWQVSDAGRAFNVSVDDIRLVGCESHEK